MFDKEEKLGGTWNKVVRIGDTVHRRDRGGLALHSYLLYLEKAGMEGVPRFLGLDQQGREILSYLPGKTQERDLLPGNKKNGHPWLRSDETIAGIASFMRRLHDVSAGFLPEALERGWINPDDPRVDTICHNDAAVWNFVFSEDGRISGLFDFDQARAGTRLWDLAWSVYGIAHLMPWEYDPALDAYVDYDHPKHAAGRKRRIKLYFDSYGMDCPPDFMELVYRRVQIGVCDALERDAAAGDKTAKRQIKKGGLAHYRKVAAHIRECGQDWM